MGFMPRGRGRQPGISKAHPADAAFWIFFAAMAGLVLFLFRDYGYSWDEIEHHRWYGMAVLRFYATLGGDLSATNTGNLHLYGGAFDSLAELLVRLSPLEPRNTRHLATALAGLMGILGTRQLSRRTGGPLAGFAAALFLALTAPYFGHMFMNAKDIPFAAGSVWSLYYLDRFLEGLPRPSFRDRAMLGLSLGLTMGVRVGGVLAALYGAALVFAEAVSFARSRGGFAAFASRLVEVARPAVPVLLSAYALMLALWPAALLNPLTKPMEALLQSGRFEWTASVLWNGRWLLSKELPWNYLPVVFGVELPPVLVVFAPLALAWAVGSVVLAVRAEDGIKARRLALLLMAALFPPVWATAGGATLYDNMRHFLFVLPPLYCLMGALLADTSNRLAARRPLMGFAPAVLALPFLLLSTIQTADLHPYEYTYKNEFAGGIPDAGKRFDTDYWLTSYREAALLVVNHAREVCRARGQNFSQNPFTVAVFGPTNIVKETLPPSFTILPPPYAGKTDYLITTTRWGADGDHPGNPVIATVSRSGMTFSVVRTSPELYEILKRRTPPGR